MVKYTDFDGATRDSDGEPCDSGLDHGEAGYVSCIAGNWGHPSRHANKCDLHEDCRVTWNGGGVIAGDREPVRDVAHNRTHDGQGRVRSDVPGAITVDLSEDQRALLAECLAVEWDHPEPEMVAALEKARLLVQNTPPWVVDDANVMAVLISAIAQAGAEAVERQHNLVALLMDVSSYLPAPEVPAPQHAARWGQLTTGPDGNYRHTRPARPEAPPTDEDREAQAAYDDFWR